MSLQDDIVQFNNRFSAALLAGDFDALGEMYTADAQFLPPNGPRVNGREAIIAMMQERHHEGPTSIAITSGEVWESGDFVVDLGSYEIAGEPPVRGAELVVFQRTPDGALQLLIDAPFSSANFSADS